MIRKTFFVAVLLLALPVFAQEAETLVSGKIEHGGFGGPVVKFTQINGEFGVLVGGRGGWIINHAFVIGGGGYGLANEIETGTQNVLAVPLYFRLGYGGLELEYINASNKLLHFTLQTLIGGGEVDQRTRDSDQHMDFGGHGNGDAFFVAEPGVNLILNVTSFFRIGAGASYRFVTGVDLGGLKNEDLTGAAAGLVFKFGKF